MKTKGPLPGQPGYILCRDTAFWIHAGSEHIKAILCPILPIRQGCVVHNKWRGCSNLSEIRGYTSPEFAIVPHENDSTRCSRHCHKGHDYYNSDRQQMSFYDL